MANSNELNLDKDWSFDVDLVGLPAPTGQNAELPVGFYEVKITDTYINKDRNANRVIFKFEVSKGPFAGTMRTDGLGIPSSAEDKVRYYWRARAESVGYTAAQLDDGEVTLSPKIFTGKTAFIKYSPGDKEAGIYQEILWLSPAEWARQRAMAEGVEPEEVEVKQETSSKKKNKLEEGGETTSKASLLDKLRSQASA